MLIRGAPSTHLLLSLEPFLLHPLHHD
jgi:hypothetical protein